MITRRAALVGAPAALLMSCAAPSVWAPDATVARARALGVGSPSLTLITVRNVLSDNGAHSALLINASQRVIFDPAGSFAVDIIPERNDVLFGITPAIEQFYVSYHARQTFYVVTQKVEVSADVAEQALALALSNGPVPRAACTIHTSRLLAQLPGFGRIRTRLFPDSLEGDMAKLPGVQTTVFREDDSDDKSQAADQINAAIQADQLE